MFTNKSNIKKILNYSPIESCRFGMRVYRGNVDEIDEKMILSNIVTEKIDVAILRIPSEKQEQLSRLNEVGLPYIVADTLVYYDIDLTRHDTKELKNKDLSFVQCGKEHLEILDFLVTRIFKGYTNHYNSNPFLPKKEILEGYKEWALGFINACALGKIAWIVKRGGNYIGFACCTYEAFKSTAVLYGIVPEASGGGIYGDLIKFTQQYFKDKGYKKMEISTQVQNFASQKVWIREGAVINKAYTTLHINSLMDYSVMKKKIFDISIPMTTTNGFLCDVKDVSQDRNNKIFINAENSNIFPEIINILVANYYAVEYPGENAMIKVQEQSFLGSLHGEMHYRLTIGFPYIGSAEGVYKSLVTLEDQQGTLYYFSHNLLKKP